MAARRPGERARKVRPSRTPSFARPAGPEARRYEVTCGLPFSRPINPAARGHQRRRASYNFQNCQRLVGIIRRRHDRQQDCGSGRKQSDHGNQHGHGPPSRNPDYLRPRGLALQLDHGGKHVQVRNEINNHGHAGQHVVGAFDIGSSLAEKNEQYPDKILNEQRDPGRFPARMQPAKHRRQKMVDAGDKWQPGHRGQISGGCPDVAQRDQECRQRQGPVIPHALDRLRDRLHQTLQVADFRGWQRHQHAYGPDNVAKRHRDSRRQHRPGNGAARILDFAAQERAGFTSPEREHQQRPENNVLEVNAWRQSVQGEHVGRAKAVPRNGAHHDHNHRRNPHGKRAHVMQPFANVQADHIHHRGERQREQRKDDVESCVVREMSPGALPHVNNVAGGEIKHGGEIWQVAGPVRPRGHESGEISERFFAPDVKPALVRISRR